MQISPTTPIGHISKLSDIIYTLLLDNEVPIFISLPLSSLHVTQTVVSAGPYTLNIFASVSFCNLIYMFSSTFSPPRSITLRCLRYSRFFSSMRYNFIFDGVVCNICISFLQISSFNNLGLFTDNFEVIYIVIPFIRANKLSVINISNDILVTETILFICLLKHLSHKLY